MIGYHNRLAVVASLVQHCCSCSRNHQCSNSAICLKRRSSVQGKTTGRCKAADATEAGTEPEKERHWVPMARNFVRFQLDSRTKALALAKRMVEVSVTLLDHMSTEIFLQKPTRLTVSVQQALQQAAKEDCCSSKHLHLGRTS